MLRFLFPGRRAEARPETQRARFARLVAELNAMIDGLPDKPRVTVDPATGHVLPETPAQFPDEALALPRPAPGTSVEGAAEGADAPPPGPAAASPAAPPGAPRPRVAAPTAPTAAPRLKPRVPAPRIPTPRAPKGG